MNRQEEIQKLQEQIWSLEREEEKDNQKMILPFLRDNHFILHYHISHLNFVEITHPNEEKIIQLIKMIEGKNTGFSNFACPLDKDVEIHFDDGALRLCFKFSGSVKDLPQKFICKVVELGLILDFSNYKKELKNVRATYDNKIQNLLDLEREYLELSSPAVYENK